MSLISISGFIFRVLIVSPRDHGILLYNQRLPVSYFVNLYERDRLIFVKRLFKEIAILKPQPLYIFTWDPFPVATYLATLYPYDTFSLEIVFKKLVTLLALMTAQRMQTLATINISNIIFSDSIIVKIPAILKISEVEKSQFLLILEPLLAKPELGVFLLVKF